MVFKNIQTKLSNHIKNKAKFKVLNKDNIKDRLKIN